MSEHQARDREAIRNGIIIPGKPPAECGNCLFASPLPQNLKDVSCGGMPPTPVIIGMSAQGPQIALMRPQVDRHLKPCALWRERLPQAEMGKAS